MHNQLAHSEGVRFLFLHRFALFAKVAAAWLVTEAKIETAPILYTQAVRKRNAEVE